MDEEKAARGNSRAESEGQPQERPQAEPPVVPAKPNAYPVTRDAGWAGAPTSQVARTVAVALLTAVVVLVALFLLWQVRTFVGWFVIALFLAAVLNPVVNWLQQRHRLIKRPLAIALTYVGLVVVLLFVVVIFLPLLVDQINGFIRCQHGGPVPRGPDPIHQGSSQAKRPRRATAEDRRPTLRPQEAAGRGAGERLLGHRTDRH